RLLAFLDSLTDRCAADMACVGAWLPNPEEDPDGHLLGADNGLAPVLEDDDVVTPEDYPDEVSLQWPGLEALPVFDELGNDGDAGTAANQQTESVVRRDGQLGLTAEHGFNLETWTYGNRWINFEVTMIAGGVTSAYLDDDCWPDLVMTGGDASGLVPYRRLVAGQGFVKDVGLLDGQGAASSYSAVTGIAVADIDGDYRRELVLGNLHQGNVKILSRNASGQYQPVADLPMT